MENLVVRTREFALCVVRVRSGLPHSPIAWVLGDKFLRSGFSVGAHFRESLHARSKAEYVSKLNGGVMEAEESLYWLELLNSQGFVHADDFDWLWDEGRQLIAIFNSLIKKWKPK